MRFATQIAALSLTLLASNSCSLALDFEDLDGLPCGCLPDFVCLVASNRCVPRHSVELFKSCTLDAVDPDALCPRASAEAPMGARCLDRDGLGPRCLPICTPTNYSTADAAQSVAAQCPVGTTCWTASDRAGVCDEGECSDQPNNCVGGSRQCVTFNGAGVCFTTCEIFVPDNSCAGDKLCHPIGASSVTACIDQGTKALGEICDDENPCQKFDDPTRRRPMICDRPMGSQGPRRCWAICNPSDGSRCILPESCTISRGRVNQSSSSLGICTTGG